MAVEAPQRLNISPERFVLSPISSITLQMSNPGPAVIVFKVRTTNPERYIVRPRHGVVQPSTAETVNISLQKGISLSTVDQFQVEYRALVAGEVTPGVDRISDYLRVQMTAAGQLVKAVTVKKVVFCTVNASDAGGETPPAAAAQQMVLPAADPAPPKLGSTAPRSSLPDVPTQPRQTAPPTRTSESNSAADSSSKAASLEAEAQKLSQSNAVLQQNVNAQRSANAELKNERNAKAASNEQVQGQVSQLEQQIVKNHPATKTASRPMWLWAGALLLLIFAWGIKQIMATATPAAAAPIAATAAAGRTA